MIVFSTCWYILKCKFNVEKYKIWIDNFLSNVNNFYLVIYTNRDSYETIKKYENNNKIKIVIFSLEEFYNYKYKNNWIANHEKNYLLKEKISWEVNMLWSEKISFVKRTIENNYFKGDWYGWCDIGYFRCETSNELSKKEIQSWPNNNKILKLDKSKIYYGIARNDNNYLNHLFKIVNKKNKNLLPEIEIPHDQWSIAGGFFILYKDNINWWHKLYGNKLQLYFNNNYLVKDDHIIIVDCIFSQLNRFFLVKDTSIFAPWFIFQKYLY